MRRFAIILSIVSSFALAGCGGGGQSAAPPNQTTSVYALPFTITSTATLPAPIGTVSMAIKLPATVTVNTVNGTASGQIDPVQITVANGLQAYAYGNYSASTHTAYISMITSSNFRGGEFLLLNCNVPTSTPFEDVLLSTILNVDVAGFDTSTSSTVDLSESTKVMLSNLIQRRW